MRRRLLELAIPLLFAAVFVASQLTYVRRDVAPQFTDGQFVHALRFFHLATGGGPHGSPPEPFPPTTYAVTALFLALFGGTMAAARASVLVFAVPFLLAMYGIGRRLGGGVWSGVAVMALAGASPYVLELSRTYFLDFPQAATTAVALWLLLASDGYRRRGLALAVGPALALTLMTKWSAAFFVLVPAVWAVLPAAASSWRGAWAAAVGGLGFAGVAGAVLYYLPRAEVAEAAPSWWIVYGAAVVLPAAALAGAGWWLLRRERWRDAAPVVHAVWAGGLFAVLGLPWYLRHAGLIWLKFTVDTGFHRDLADNAGYLVAMLATSYTAAPLLALAGLVALAARRRRRWEVGGQLVGLAAGGAVLVGWGLPEARYFVTLTLFTAALCGSWVSAIGAARHAVGGALLVVSLLGIVAWTVVPGSWGIFQPLGVALIGPTTVPTRVLCSAPPDGRRVDLDGVVAALRDDAGGEWPGAPRRVVLVFERAFGPGAYGGLPFEQCYLQEEALRRGLDLEVVQWTDVAALRAALSGGKGGRAAEQVDRTRKASDFVVIHTTKLATSVAAAVIAEAAAPRAVTRTDHVVSDSLRAVVLRIEPNP